MLSAKFRFHGYGALKYLFGQGKTYRLRSLSIRVAANSRREYSRASVVVSKKVLKAAPLRNRVRRRVYEILRTNWHHIEPAHDILLTIYDPNCATMPASDLEREVIDSLKQAKIWKD